MALRHAPDPGAPPVAIRPGTAPIKPTLGYWYSKTMTSTNWAGYEDIQSNSYNLVTAVWTVPDVSGPAGSNSAQWIGIGGDTTISANTTLFQTSLQSAINSYGYPYWDLWYEYVSTNQKTINPKVLTYNVSPGDVIYAEVVYDGNGTFTPYIEDETTGTPYAGSAVSTSWATTYLNSADYIVENPGGCGQPCQPLADFGTVQFSSAYADQNGTKEPGEYWPYQLDNMVDSWGDATPSGWGANETSFSVKWSPGT